MARRVARVRREALSSRWTSRAVAMDDEGRRPVGAGLDADHEERERGQPPVAEAGTATSSTPTRTGITMPPASVEPTQERSTRSGVRSRGEPAVESLVPARTPPIWRSTFVSRKPSAIVSADEQHVAADDGDEEDADRMRRADAAAKRSAGPPGAGSSSGALGGSDGRRRDRGGSRRERRSCYDLVRHVRCPLPRRLVYPRDTAG